MERKPDRGLVLYGRLGFIEHVSHAGHQMDENVEIEYNRFFFIFHRHILVVVYGMSIL